MRAEAVGNLSTKDLLGLPRRRTRSADEQRAADGARRSGIEDLDEMNQQASIKHRLQGTQPPAPASWDGVGSSSPWSATRWWRGSAPSRRQGCDLGAARGGPAFSSRWDADEIILNPLGVPSRNERRQILDPSRLRQALAAVTCDAGFRGRQDDVRDAQERITPEQQRLFSTIAWDRNSSSASPWIRTCSN